MTKRFDLYGAQSMQLVEIARRVEDGVGLLIEPRDSSYRGGEYYRGKGDTVEEVIVQANFEDAEGYLAEPNFPRYGILVYVVGADEDVRDRFRAILDLTLLRTEFV